MTGGISLALILACAPPEVAPQTIQAIIQVESRGDPWAMGINLPGQPSRSYRPGGVAVARQVVDAVVARGGSVDLGLMQVNNRNLKALGYSIEQMFDPCTNIRAGALILQEAYGRVIQIIPPGQMALRAALSAYNTGDMERGFANGYVERYERLAIAPR